jgi:hypothetical protein
VPWPSVLESEGFRTSPRRCVAQGVSEFLVSARMPEPFSGQRWSCRHAGHPARDGHDGRPPIRPRGSDRGDTDGSGRRKHVSGIPGGFVACRRSAVRRRFRGANGRLLRLPWRRVRRSLSPCRDRVVVRPPRACVTDRRQNWLLQRYRSQVNIKGRAGSKVVVVVVAPYGAAASGPQAL